MNNPCEHIRVERHKPGLSRMFSALMADAVGRSEDYTKKLFNL